MICKKAQEIFPAYKCDLARVDRFRCDLVRLDRHGGHQSEQFSCPGNSHDEGLAFRGADGELYLALAQDIDPA